jgi:hypothetical protein
MMVKTKWYLLLNLLGLVLFTACQPSSTSGGKTASPAFLQQTYWLSNAFLNAVASDSDSIGQTQCMELHFRFKDSVLVVNCESDAMLCAYQIVDDKTIEITSGFGDEARLSIGLVGKDEIELSGIFDNQKIRFKPVQHPSRDPRGLSVRYLAEYLAGTYRSKSDAVRIITLNGNGKVTGLGEYNKFETAVSGNLNATDQGNLVYFVSDRGEMPLVWQKRGDTLNFWKLKNVSGPDDIPWYELDGMYDTWTRKR